MTEISVKRMNWNLRLLKLLTQKKSNIVAVTDNLLNYNEHNQTMNF